MGFGDPYHKHPLKEVYNLKDGMGNCFQCELPLFGSTGHNLYGCTDCDYYIHKLCHDLPKALLHPLHDQHHLTLFESPTFFENSPFLCNQCQNPCLGRFAYRCTTCEVFFHTKCLFILKLEKHKHPLIFNQSTYGYGDCYCEVCGFPVTGFNFGCTKCYFFIHHQCSFIPLMVKRHHVHELTLRHNFPEECDQVYCDLCEDKDGELNRKLSHYYCKQCDYIAHVHCCITQPREDAILYKLFTHEHPMRLDTSSDFLLCTQCNYTISPYTNQYPSFIKHPCHPLHNLVVDREQDDAFKCTECQFTMDNDKAVWLSHPLWEDDLEFECKNSLFRCDACGELGKGSRVMYEAFLKSRRLDLHLECFALPGKVEYKSHPHHPLYLRWLGKSTSRYCSVCAKEIDPQLWFYFCQESEYSAHLDCVAGGILSTLRSSIKNQPDFCAIIEPDKTSFKYQITDRTLPQSFAHRSHGLWPPLLEFHGDIDRQANCETGDDVLHCPKCNLLISTEAHYSTKQDPESRQFKNLHKNSITAANDQTQSGSEPLSFLDEHVIDESCCFICDALIFPPMYSCASCQIFFHKSCAELPQKILFFETTYVLTASSFPESFSACSYCKHPISNFAYLSSEGGKIFDVHCALGAPFFNQIYHNHGLCFTPAKWDSECNACKSPIKAGTLIIGCVDICLFQLHPLCGLLPLVIKHRIHQHPLELATNLLELDDEYICDVCEKELNPNLWAYRCVDICGIRATSHVSCVITSKKKFHFRYEYECRNIGSYQKWEFLKKEAGIRKYGKRPERLCWKTFSSTWKYL